MDIATIKKQLEEGTLSDKDLESLLAGRSHQRKNRLGPLLLKGIREGYTGPLLFRATLEFILLLAIITGLLVLMYHGTIPVIAGTSMLAFITGFILGKMR